MKKILTSLLLITGALCANAQTNVAEDFNTVCSGIAGFPMDWISYNTIPSTVPDGAWTCAPVNGRYGTSGIKCTGVWGTPAAYHADTAYLITRGLDLSGYGGSIFIHFDTKVSNINLGARMAFVVTSDSSKFDTVGGTTYSDRTSFISPTFGNDDSTEWVTHSADLTPYKNTVPLYVAFRYTSTASTGSTWFIDNVFTTTFPTQLSGPGKEKLLVNVVGMSTSSSITLSCTSDVPGPAKLGLYDLVGRQLYSEDIMLENSKSTHMISGLNLASGMYLIRLSNGIACTTVKTAVQ